jgi:anti-sigma regulatory factor (Ser/Thr protein kinase)
MTGPTDSEPAVPWARLGLRAPLARVTDDDTSAATVLRVKLPSSTRSASVARSLVAALLDARDVDEGSRDDLVLAVSEASSNAIEYGTGRHVDLCLEVDRNGCLVSVSNAVDEAPTVGTGPMLLGGSGFEATMPGAIAMRGRGVAIIDSLMDSMAIEIVDRRCVVEMYRRLGS